MTITRRGAALERLQSLAERNMFAARAAGLVRVRVEDEVHDGGHIEIDGRTVVNMGSCAYMGLNVDGRLKAAATAAIERFGPVFSSSTVYTSVDLYSELEEHLRSIMGDHVLVPTTTTLGHLAFFQVAPEPGDVVIVDQQAHASIHMALSLPRTADIDVRSVAHNDVEALERAVADAVAAGAERVWYAADGVYSMYGDVAPLAQLSRLLTEYDKLHVYIDDAHGFGWWGSQGRGLAIEALGHHSRAIIATSLSKSFGSGGAAIRIPDGDLADRVLRGGGTFTFSGPLHPAELGAAVASARIHRGAEHSERQRVLHDRIGLMADLLHEADLPIVDDARTPIWFLQTGPLHSAIDVGRTLLEAGFYTNISAYPAVPHGASGIRFTQTLYQPEHDIERFVEALHAAWMMHGGDTDSVDLRDNARSAPV